MVISGSAMPVIIPNSAIACSSENPNVASLRGIMNEISIVTIDDAVRAKVIEELCFITSSSCPFGDRILFPDLKYMIVTRTLENTQAIESDNVAFTPPLMESPGITNKIIKHIIRINCSKNSEKLIEKNFFCPQSEPRSTE